MLKHKVAIALGKLTHFLIQATASGAGTNLPGKLALGIAPDLLQFLTRQVNNKNLVVSGTNGKTTTAGFIASILKANQYTILHNQKGANMLTGVLTSALLKASVSGKLTVDYSVLEIDEAYYSKIAGSVANDVLVVTNLFRDQLDRYGELDTTAKKIKEGIYQVLQLKPLQLVLNADDPIVTSLYQAENNLQPLFYGIKNIQVPQVSTKYSPFELASCSCGTYYQYNKLFFGHMGHYFCPSCHAATPDYDVWVEDGFFQTESSTLEIRSKGGHSFKLTVKMPGLYNVYNALSAISAAIALQIPVEKIIIGIESFITVFGRAEIAYIQGTKVIIQLIKNPIGASEVLKTFVANPHARLLIAINDNYADGKDVSWLWDTDFELLQQYKKKIICSGTRACDIAVRLQQAGVSPEQLCVLEDLKIALRQAIDEVNTENQEVLYVLPTYTVLLAMQKIMPTLM